MKDTRKTDGPQAGTGVADARCRVEMFGGLQIVRGGECVTRFARQKAGALLAFLALHPRPQPRERLIDLFWPDMDLPEGRDNLSTALGSLRRQLEPPGIRKGTVLAATHTQVGLSPAAVETDVAEFERLLDRAGLETAPRPRAALLALALALYRGDLLPGFYDDWAVRETERLQARCLAALGQFGRDQETLGDLTAALEAAERRVAADPYTEAAHLDLIRLHVATGRGGAGREAYRRFERLFRDEFGAPPAPESQQTAQKLLGALPDGHAAPRKPKGSPPREAQVGTAGMPVLPAPAPPSRAAPPLVLSRFFGREGEIAQIIRLLVPSKDAPLGPDVPETACRLVTLVGPGGIGKTRLSLEFARQAADRFGLWCGFLPLADLTAAGQIADRLAATLQITPDPAADPMDQVAAFFREQDRPGTPALLVLDNLEHLLPDGEEEAKTAVGAVRALLERVPGLTLLCTSRRRLGLMGERLVPVAALPTPETPDTEEAPQDLGALAAGPSVRLYVDRAQAVRPDFALTPTNAAAVAALCRQLEGSPLGLELAAAWVRLLPPRKMWERLTQGQEMPDGRYADLPPRHRSLSAALEWSYRLLTPAQQRLFASLSVFAGGWTLEAAEEVCAEPDALEHLAALLEASLVTAEDGPDGECRYRFLETVRTFSRRRLGAIGQESVVRHRHAAFFTGLAERSEPDLRGPQQARWLARLEAEHDNFRAALAFCLGAPGPSGDGGEDAEAGLRLAGSLMRFWSVHGHWSEGRRWLALALTREGGPSRARAKALNGLGGFVKLQGDIPEARARFEESLAMRRLLGERGRVADTLHNLALLELESGNLDQAQTLYEESLAIQRELGDTLAVADELHHLGYLTQERGDLDRALALYEESLALRRPLGDLRGIAYTLNNVANLAETRGDSARSRVLSEEALAIRRSLGDRVGEALSLHDMAHAAIRRGDFAAASGMGREALKIYVGLGDRRGTIQCLQVEAVTAQKTGRAVRAARLLGAVEGLGRTQGPLHHPLGPVDDDPLREELRRQCGPAAFDAAWTEGQALSWTQVADYALDTARPDVLS